MLDALSLRVVRRIIGVYLIIVKKRQSLADKSNRSISGTGVQRWVISSAMNGARSILIRGITTVSNGVVDSLAILDYSQRLREMQLPGRTALVLMWCRTCRFVKPITLSISKSDNLVDVERRMTGRIERGRSVTSKCGGIRSRVRVIKK